MPVTIQEIARRTGLSSAAVSQALRGTGRLSAATRERVRAIASELGYSLDPLLSEALSRVRTPNRSPYRESVALLAETSQSDFTPAQQEMLKGALECAASIGYRVEVFIANGAPSQHRHLSGVLRSQGIRGIIILPRLESRRPRMHLEWKHFAAVEIGRTLWQPRSLHRVATESIRNTYEAVHLLKKIGYRRIGIAMEEDRNPRQSGMHYADFLVAKLRVAARDQIPMFSPEGSWTFAEFRKWMEQHRPEVLFIDHHELIHKWLLRMKLNVPGDISIFCVDSQQPGISGLRRDYAGMGRAALEMLSRQLAYGEMGLPSHPRSMNLDEIWQPGDTLGIPIDPYLTAEGCLRSRTV